MKRIYRCKNRLLLVFSLICLMMAGPQISSANEPKTHDETLRKIIKTTQKIERDNLIFEGLPAFESISQTRKTPEHVLIETRIWLIQAFSAMNAQSVENELAEYRSIAQIAGSERDIKMSEMLTAYLDITQAGSDIGVKTKATERINTYADESDKFIRTFAWYFDALASIYELDFNSALESANQSLKLIEADNDPASLEASIAVNGLISSIYLILANVEMASESVDLYIQQARNANRQVDGLSILNNFTYVLSKWGEHETALITSEASYRLSAQTTPDKRVKAGYRYAQSLNAVEQYSKAETVADASLPLSMAGIWQLNLKAEKAIALAGQGKIDAAQVEVKALEAAIAGAPKYADRFDAKIRRTQALIARNQNNSERVFELMDESARAANRRVLSNASKETQKLMGTLANDKEVQRAREGELTTQNTLQKERIISQDRQSRLMMIVILLLCTLVTGAIIWALRQRAYAKSEAVLKEKAKAGEKAKRDFLAVMSHELRTPLNGIIGLAEILSRDGPSDDVKFKTGVIYKSGLNLLELLTNVLDMSKMEGGNTQIDRLPTALRSITDNLIALWQPEAERKGLTLTLHIADDVPRLINLDPLRTRQCLENLISNAIKFTNAGRVHVHVTWTAGAKPEADGVLTVIVADTGEGMSPEKSAEVFKPFTQADVSIRRKFGGSGLGLAITRSLARLMDGDATVISAQGRGSEFTLTLRGHDSSESREAQIESTTNADLRPTIKERFLIADAKFNPSTQPDVHAELLPSPAQTQATLTVPPPMPTPPTPTPFIPQTAPQVTLSPARQTRTDMAQQGLSGMRVLIVDDLQTNREVLKIFLKPVGCQILTANDGKAALDILSAETVDMILMDVHMPGVDGIDAIKALRTGGGPNAAVPVIALTADASPQSNARCMGAGADVFLTKPVVAQELFSAMAVLKSRNAQAPYSLPDTGAVA